MDTLDKRYRGKGLPDSVPPANQTTNRRHDLSPRRYRPAREFCDAPFALMHCGDTNE
jgi:hypothetical protein